VAYKFLLGINRLKCNADLKGGINIGMGLNLTNNVKKIGPILKNEMVAKSLGTLETGFLLNSDLLVYGELQLDLPNDESKQRYVYSLVAYCTNLLNALWVVGDFSLYTEQGYLIQLDPSAEVHSHRMVNATSRSDGTLKSSTVSKSLLKKFAATYLGEMKPSVQQAENIALTDDARWFANGISASEYGSTRTSRFISFINLARASDDLGIKVANYVTALEALLASSGGEIRHQLSERVSVILGGPDRLGTYKQMQDMYDIRSRILHGDVAPKKIDITRTSCNAHDICRKVYLFAVENIEFNTIILSKNQGDLKQYFLKKMLQ